MPRKQSDVEKSLLAKGFRTKEGDHNYFNYHSRAGKKTAVFTKTSHGAREIDDSLLSRMAKQCKLSNKDFGLLMSVRWIVIPMKPSSSRKGLLKLHLPDYSPTRPVPDTTQRKHQTMP